jgi:hypothetical protein
MRYSETLVRRYREKIEAWDWDRLAQSCLDDLTRGEGGSIVGRARLGSATEILPSGKIYTQGTTNQNIRDILRDQAFLRALESVAEERGLYVEGFSDNLYVCTVLDDGTEAVLWKEHDRNFSVK